MRAVVRYAIVKKHYGPPSDLWALACKPAGPKSGPPIGGSKKSISKEEFVMEGGEMKKQGVEICKFSILLELSAANDLNLFRHAVEEEGLDVDEGSFWYGRAIGSKKMGLQERTPLMISAMFGCKEIVEFILSTGLVDVNRACGSDGATALHCAAAGGSVESVEIVKLLIDSSADVNCVDANGRKPCDVIGLISRPSFISSRKTIEMLLKGEYSFGDELVSFDEAFNQQDEQMMQTPQKDGSEKKEYPIDLSLPDIKNGIYGTDEFRMYTFKNQSNLIPPTLQLPGSRLKSALSARDLELDMNMLGFENRHHHQQQQALMDEISNLSSPASWSNSMATVAALAASSGGRTGDYNRLGGVRPTNLEDMFGSLDASMLSQLQGLAMKSPSPQINSPTGLQMRQNINQQLRSSYPSNMPSSPVRSPSSFGLDPSSAAALMSSRSAAFAKRSQSFIDRGALNRHLTASANSASTMASTFSDWGSPSGKLDWGIQGEELNKLRKSASFGLRSSNSMTSNVEEPDVSWVQSLVKDVQPMGTVRYSPEEIQQQYHLTSGGSEMLSPWVEQVYMEQEQLVA
ncbi:hypothetical protein IFM89_036995 [Coptis chinensis]|uniref:Uncharacterized protein n=1 Tax=Coptis chinensis TaxID=261450 RepID=A0A835HHM7_9MAGN|nr:hypothetical protein IFM89_036995 [Coptis chinensis]